MVLYTENKNKSHFVAYFYYRGDIDLLAKLFVHCMKKQFGFDKLARTDYSKR